MTGWVAELRTLGVVEVARRLDLRVLEGGRRLAACPECHEETRSRHDTRAGPVFLTARGLGWCCSRCGAKGSAVELAALTLLQGRLGKGDPRWATLREQAAERGLLREVGPARVYMPPPAPPPRPRISTTELAALWESSSSASGDLEVADWLSGRGFDPEMIARRDLCRALPVGRLPRWAHFRGVSWSRGWRALVRAWDERGQLASLRARWVRNEPPPHGGDKAGAAAGGPGSAGGAVLACSLARRVLETGRRPDWLDPDESLCVVVAEGEPDWLTWASRETSRTMAVFGVYSGSWAEEIAARIPDDSSVVLRVHHDTTGDRYAEQIARSLYYRCAVVRGSADVAQVP